MARGRKAKPAGLAEAQGNPGRRPVPPDLDDMTAAGGPRAPRWLSKVERQVWDRLAGGLLAANFVRDTDALALARYCHHVARWAALTSKLRHGGETYTSRSKHGDLHRLRPELLARERAENHLIALEDRFGLSPRARQELMRGMAAGLGMPPGGLFVGEQPHDEAQDADADVPVVGALLPPDGARIH